MVSARVSRDRGAAGIQWAIQYRLESRSFTTCISVLVSHPVPISQSVLISLHKLLLFYLHCASGLERWPTVVLAAGLGHSPIDWTNREWTILAGRREKIALAILITEGYDNSRLFYTDLTTILCAIDPRFDL